MFGAVLQHSSQPNLMWVAVKRLWPLCPRITQLVLVGLLVALLGGSSVLCIVHCHLIQLLTPPTLTVYGVTLSLCHTPLDSSESTPAPLDLSLFYGVRLSVPLLLIHIALLLVAALRLSLPHLIHTCVLPPDPPPPRSA